MEGFKNKLSCQGCKYCFTQSPLMTLLTEDEIDLVNENRYEASFKSGEIIYKQGTPLSHLVIIYEGFGKIYIENETGRNLTLTYTRPLEINGGIGVFIDKRHHSSLMAVTDSDACFIDVEAFKSVMWKNQKLMEAYLKAYAKRVMHTYHQFALLTQKNMEGRMAASLIYLHEEIFGSQQISHITKQDLAELTAMTRESAIRVLKSFKDDGLINMHDSQSFEILDKPSLELIARHG